MPVMSWAHVQYWEGSATVAPITTTSATVGYPAWQTSVIVVLLFLAVLIGH